MKILPALMLSAVAMLADVPSAPSGELTVTTVKACGQIVQGAPLFGRTFCMFVIAKTTRPEARYLVFSATYKKADGSLAFASMSAPVQQSETLVVFPTYDQVISVDVQQISVDGRILSSDRTIIDP